MEKNMKEKLLTATVIVLVLIILVGGSYATSELSYYRNNCESSSNTTDEYSIYNKITIDDYIALFREDKLSIIYLGRPTCSVCTLQNPILKNIIEKYNIKINYLNLDDMSKDNINTLYTSYDKFVTDGIATPTIMIIGNKKVSGFNRGYTSESDLIQFFKTNKIIQG